MAANFELLVSLNNCLWEAPIQISAFILIQNTGCESVRFPDIGELVVHVGPSLFRIRALKHDAIE